MAKIELTQLQLNLCESKYKTNPHKIKTSEKLPRPVQNNPSTSTWNISHQLESSWFKSKIHSKIWRHNRVKVIMYKIIQLKLSTRKDSALEKQDINLKWIIRLTQSNLCDFELVTILLQKIKFSKSCFVKLEAYCYTWLE